MRESSAFDGSNGPAEWSEWMRAVVASVLLALIAAMLWHSIR